VRDDHLQMMLSLYVTLGVFLLLASRNPSGASQPDRLRGMVELRPRRTMAVQAFFTVSERAHLLYGVLMFVIIV